MIDQCFIEILQLNGASPMSLNSRTTAGNIRKLFLFVLFIIATMNVFSQPGFLITSFGAKGDGQTMNTTAIQNAIDKAAVKGGNVVVPAGRFITGPVTLKSGVELHLSKNAFLLGSTNRLDYGNDSAKPLISAKGAVNISITGQGTIDGRGGELVENLIQQLKAHRLHDTQWPLKAPREEARPQIINFKECDGVMVKGITIKNSAAWVQSYVRCNGVTIDSIHVESVAYWNNDGIDIVNSKNVSISNCIINASDDAICLKSEGSFLDSCVNVSVTNCNLRSSANAFKLGTGSKGGFRNITVDGLIVYDTYRSAIALEAVDGGFLENVNIKNVKATNTGSAIFIRLGHRNKNDKYSRIKNISIANVYVQVPAGKPDKGYPMEGPTLKYPPGTKPSNTAGQSVLPWNNSGKDTTAIPYLHNVFPSSITGLPNHQVQNVRLENIEIIYEGGADKSVAFFPADSLAGITEAVASYPEFSMFGELPSWGLYVRHVDGLVMKNIRMQYKKDDYRTAMIFDDVKDLQLTHITIPTIKEAPAIILNKVEKPSLQNINLPVAATKGIKVQ